MFGRTCVGICFPDSRARRGGSICRCAIKLIYSAISSIKRRLWLSKSQFTVHPASPSGSRSHFQRATRIRRGRTARSFSSAREPSRPCVVLPIAQWRSLASCFGPSCEICRFAMFHAYGDAWRSLQSVEPSDRTWPSRPPHQHVSRRSRHAVCDHFPEPIHRSPGRPPRQLASRLLWRLRSPPRACVKLACKACCRSITLASAGFCALNSLPASLARTSF
jgi:hypothetical protein